MQEGSQFQQEKRNDISKHQSRGLLVETKATSPFKPVKPKENRCQGKKRQVFFQNLPDPLSKTESTRPTIETVLHTWEAERSDVAYDFRYFLKNKIQGPKNACSAHSSNDTISSLRKEI